jgi:hypothetical protein
LDTAVIDAPPQTVRERLIDRLSALHLNVAQGEDTGSVVVAVIRRGALDRAWVNCPRVSYKDPYADEVHRFSWTTPAPDSGRVQASLEPADGGTRVVVESRFIGTYDNTYTFSQQTAACHSTGRLEQILLAAAAGQAAP